MPRVKILQTTTLGSRRFAKGDVVRLDEDAARDLIACGKAQRLDEPKNAGGKDDAAVSRRSRKS